MICVEDMDKNRGKNFIKDIIIFAIGGIGSKLLLFLLVPLYTNVLTKEEYGTADLVSTVAQLIIPFLSVVIYDAVLRFGLSKFERKEDVLVVALIIWGLSWLVGLLIIPAIHLYPVLLDWKWYLYFYVNVSIGSSILSNYIKVKGLNKLFAIINILQTAILVILNILFLIVLRWNIAGYLLSSILSIGLSIVIIFFAGNLFNDLKIAKFDSYLFKRMLKYSFPLILNNVSWWVIHSSDKIMLELMVGVVALGVYTVATKIPSLINVVISFVSSAWNISATKEMEDSNDESFYSVVFEVLTFFVFCACILIVFIIKPFMSIYVGKDFDEAWQYVPLLLVSAVFSAISSYCGSLYGALKKPMHSMVTTLLAAIINIVLNFVFIPQYGIWGAIIGTIVAYFVIALVRLIDIMRYIKFAFCYPVLALNCLIIVVQAVFVSFDFYKYIISSVSLISFILLNIKTIKFIFNKIGEKNARSKRFR